MAKSTRTPLELFFAKSLKMSRARDVMKGNATDDNVTIAYLVGLYHGQKGLCIHTGEIMTIVRGLVEGAVVFDLCTMDRIDNTMGYTVGNIALCCDGINRMRGDMPLSKFKALCKRIGMNPI